MKKLLLTLALVLMAAPTFAAGGGHDVTLHDGGLEGKDIEALKDKKAELLKTTGGLKEIEKATKFAEETVDRSEAGVVNQDRDTAAASIERYILLQNITIERIQQLRDSKDPADKVLLQSLVLAASQGKGKGVAILLEKQKSPDSKWSKKALDKLSVVADNLLKNLQDKMPTLDAIKKALSDAGFDKETIKQILEACFGIK